ncbi:TrmH family RNA methyltransferase [Paenibacillus protaetiae]|uniref:RNA methyltransferase n=1 Tax=Paenibacillus protaetiae TaxID=2509456 RepID=A0A4P6EUY1_9BACL|nr:RNA methyltransferase [Paenibacillus protaetiae]QAY66802.1 RNA methyltransferase [Paenibacillus protaetiae]
MNITITSVHNERVKQWAALLDKKHRDRSGRFIIEGIHLIKEAFDAGAAVHVVVYDMERGVPSELEPYMDGAGAQEWAAASTAVMAKCTGTDSAPPVFAVVGKRNNDTSALFRQDSLVVVLDGVRDPGNAGTIIRAADAAGADAVVLGKGCVDLYNPKTVRSTMGSLFHLPIIEADLSKLLPEAQERGMRLVGTSLQAQHTCYSYDWRQPSWMLFGSEADGLSPAVLAMVNETVIIPMKGKAESLNVAMAASVLLYEALRQRHYR